MPETPALEKEKLILVADDFLEAIADLSIIEPLSLELQAQAVEYIGRRVRDECCADELRGHAILANQILTIATTRMA